MLCNWLTGWREGTRLVDDDGSHGTGVGELTLVLRMTQEGLGLFEHGL